MLFSIVLHILAIELTNGQRPSYSLLRNEVIPDPIDWTYGELGFELGPANWGRRFPTCARFFQSPIDIRTRRTRYHPSLTEFIISYNPFLPGSRFGVHNDGHAIQVNTEGQFYITNGGLSDLFKTEQFHFHWGSNSRWGSEHTLNGRRSSMEMHIVSWNVNKYPSFTEAAKYRGGLSIQAVMFQISPYDNPILEPIVQVLHQIRDPDRHVKVNIPAVSMRAFLPLAPDRYFRYEGSLTTPRCFESVIWTIYEQKQTISERQLNAFRSMLTSTDHAGSRARTIRGRFIPLPFRSSDPIYTERHPLVDNIRFLQPLNGRTVYRSFHSGRTRFNRRRPLF